MAVLFGGVAVGCSGPRYVALDSGTPDASAPAGSLSLVSASTLMLHPGETTSIDVRFLDATGSPRAGVAIAAAIEGTALDATLGALSASTDDTGLAHASLTAGTSASSFRVRLSAALASSPQYVDVGVGTSFGTLVVHAPYAGTRPVTHRVIDVVPGVTCAALSSMPPTSGGRTVRSLTDDVTITALPTTLSYAVLVRANGDLALEALGCAEGVVPTSGAPTTISVTLTEVPLGIAGGYAVDVSLRAGGGMQNRIAQWAIALRAAVAAQGGDAALLLNGVEAELARTGASADATHLHSLRTSSSLDAALAAQLDDDGTSPTAVIASLLDEAAVALDSPTFSLTLTLGATSNGSLTTESVTCSDGRSGTVVLAHVPVVRTIMPSAIAGGMFTLEGPVDAQAGSLARAWVDAVGADRAHVHTIQDVLAGQCSSLDTFASTVGGMSALASCGATCRANACATALASLETILDAGMTEVDHDLDHVQLAGSVAMRDDDGDARVDRLDGTLHGQLVALDGTVVGPSGTVSGTLTGTRAPVP